MERETITMIPTEQALERVIEAVEFQRMSHSLRGRFKVEVSKQNRESK